MAAIKSAGATLARGGVTIATVVNVTPGTDSAQTSETTHLGSTATSHLGIGIEDGGEWTFLITYDPTEATHTNLLQTDLKSGTAQTFRCTFSDASYREVSGIVTGFAVQSMEPQNHVTAQVTIKTTGAVTESP